MAEVKPQNIRILSGIFLSVLVIFIADLYLKLETVLTVLFVAPLLISLFHPGRMVSLVTALVCTGLTFFIFFTGDISMRSIVNLVVSVTGIWTALFFILKFKSASLVESKTRERLDALFQYATEGIIITNKQGEIMMINPKAEKQFGYDPGELISKRIEILIPERLSERHVKHREKYSKHPYPRPMGKGTLLFARRKDGLEFPVEISLSNFTTEEGSFVIAFIIDISERRKAEELLQREKEIAQMYLDIAPVIFMVLSDDQKVTLINQTGCQVLGLPENQIIDKNWFDHFVSNHHREEARKTFTMLMEGTPGNQGLNEYEIIQADGNTRLIAWKNTLIRDEKGRPVAILHSGEDITEVRKQEDTITRVNQELQQYSNEILKLNADLEKRVHERTVELAELIHKLEKINDELANEVSERREAEKQLERKREELKVALEKEKELSELKSRFVTMASHEFRTPLSTILSSASLISKYNDPSFTEKRNKHIERIKSSVNNLTSILNDFLSIGKLEEGKVYCTPSEFDITTFSNDLVSELKELTKAGQTITYTHSGTSTRVFLDKNLTRNICINLLSNAIKYSEEHKPVEFQTLINDNQFIIRVKDQGIGIPEAEQQHIFERFFRANNAGNIQGTGLGLNIVKKYAELMGGHVTFNSIFEKGTTFIVSLPARSPQLN